MKRSANIVSLLILILSVIGQDAGVKAAGAPPASFSSNLPLVVINTNNQQILNEPPIVADMGIIDNGVGNRNYLTDPFNDYDGKIEIEIRGSTSLSYPKKSYRVETQDLIGNNLNVSLLGMPAENDWVLYAPTEDRTYMRNVLSFKWSNEMGRYAPRTRYCELFINGVNQGIYVLMEKVKRDANRLNIRKMTQSDTSGMSVSGGFLLKIDRTAGCGCYFWDSPVPTQYPYSTLENGHMRWQIQYPKQAYLQQQQIDYIKNFIDSFELTVDGPYFSDFTNGYHKYIDLSSFVDHVILQEFTANSDAYRLSAYLYKDNDYFNQKLNAGPLWDFNRSLGNHSYASGWRYAYYTSYANYQVPEFWKKLLTDTVFQDAWKCRWLEVRQHILNTDTINVFIDSLVSYLSEASVRDQQIWGGGDFFTAVSGLRSFVGSRAQWIDLNIPGNCVLGSPALAQRENKIRIYPNPAREHIFISSAGECRLLLRDITGRTIRSVELHNGMEQVDVSALRSGVYLWIATYDDAQQVTGKLVVSKQ